MAEPDLNTGSKVIFAQHPSRDAPVPPPGVTTLPDLLEFRAGQNPSYPLLTFAGEAAGTSSTLTYADVADRAARLSAPLRRLLERPSSSTATPVIGIWFEKSLELHLAIFATTRSGAAWLPFDPDVPAARVAVCLKDSAARVLLCDEAHRERALEAVGQASCSTQVVTFGELKRLGAEVGLQSSLVGGPGPADTAYIIYTSGSTGTPKGIAIPHSAALTFALSERTVLGTNESDVVWQGFSPAFDMFIEEVWVSIAGGAQLVIGCRAQCQNVAGLGGPDGVWARHGVTIVNAVPTLINIMTSLSDGDGLPSSVRLLNLGGEACPPALVQRLWRPSLTIVNTYGPTETTVTATYDILHPDQPLTIGLPLPSYHVLLLPIPEDAPSDASVDVLSPLELAKGVEGQLCIGGPCVGSGYVGRPEWTAAKFIAHPLIDNERLYLTGDRVRLEASGKILYLGRIDTQVKHRGFRIELGEIENALSAHDFVQVAAVICANAGEEDARLEAFLVLQEDRYIEEGEMTRALQPCLAGLPSYMQPEAIFYLRSAEMPRLSSGKINSKGLHELSKQRRAFDAESARATSVAQTADTLATSYSPSLAILMAVMSSIFPQHARTGVLNPKADFFFDLGGHSLLAAILVSRLRKEAIGTSLEGLGLADIYECRTPQALAAKYPETDVKSIMEDEGKYTLSYNSDDGEAVDFLPVSNWKFAICGAFQLPAILFFGFLNTVSLLVPYLIFDVAYGALGAGWAILGTYAAFVVIPPFLTIVGLIGKWVALGVAQEGEYPLYGLYYYRWWLASRFVDLIDQKTFADSGLYPVLLRLLGAKVGSYCHLSAMQNGPALDLIELGDDVIIGKDSMLNVNHVERGRLILRRVTIGSEAHIGTHCVIDGGSRMAPGSELAALSMLPEGTMIPEAERWHGSPAKFLAPAEKPFQGKPSRPSRLRAVTFDAAAYFLGSLILPLMYLLPQIPSLMVFVVLSLGERDIGRWAQTALLAIPASLAYIVCVFLELVVFRRLLLGKVKPGVHKMTSVYFLRKWLVDRLMDLSLTVLHPVYATLYVVPYLRALGVNIGKGAEVSNARGVNFDLVDIGPEAFVADNVVLGDSSVHSNELTLEKTSMAPRAFAGNSSILPQGTRLESNTLVGVLSIAPDLKTPLLSGESCFGSPPVRMPVRQQCRIQHADHLLYRPRASQIATRLLVEGGRIWLPRMAIIFAIAFGLQIFETGYPAIGAVNTLLMLPLFELVLLSLPALVVTVAVKWALVQRYQIAEWPLWSLNVWLSEFVTATYESLLAPLLLSRLVGTPFLAIVLRMLGAKIGKRCTLLSHDMTEWDMVSMGDESTINLHAGPQTHLFEDRVMKVGTVDLGRRSVMKPYSICLPNSSIGRSALLGSLSLLMKGESVPEYQSWHGAPIVPIPKKDVRDIREKDSGVGEKA